jgi:hypothetical protein
MGNPGNAGAAELPLDGSGPRVQYVGAKHRPTLFPGGTMCPERRPCPGVPFFLVSAQIKYCVYHQTWTLVVWAQSVEDDSESATTYARELSFGPFDSLRQVVQEMHTSVEAALGGPGVPWVDAPSWDDPEPA